MKSKGPFFKIGGGVGGINDSACRLTLRESLSGNKISEILYSCQINTRDISNYGNSPDQRVAYSAVKCWLHPGAGGQRLNILLAEER